MSLVVLGVGNDLLGDDAIGLLAAAELERKLPKTIDVKRSRSAGLYLIDDLLDYDDAIVIDSIVGENPGKVREMRIHEMHPAIVPSPHYLGLPEALAMAESSGLKVPKRLRILAIEMGRTQRIGAEPSPKVLTAIPEVVHLVRKIATEWGYTVRTASGEQDK